MTWRRLLRLVLGIPDTYEVTPTEYLTAARRAELGAQWHRVLGWTPCECLRDGVPRAGCGTCRGYGYLPTEDSR